MSKYNFVRSNYVLVYFGLIRHSKRWPNRTVFFLYLMRACYPYVLCSSNLEADVEIYTCRCLETTRVLRYSVKHTELTNSNSGLLISKLCHSLLKTPNVFIHPTLTPSPTTTAIACILEP